VQQIEAQRWVRGRWSSTKFSELQFRHLSIRQSDQEAAQSKVTPARSKKANRYF
jgi:hypothetical protein